MCVCVLHLRFPPARLNLYSTAVTVSSSDFHSSLFQGLNLGLWSILHWFWHMVRTWIQFHCSTQSYQHVMLKRLSLAELIWSNTNWHVYLHLYLCMHVVWVSRLSFCSVDLQVSFYASTSWFVLCLEVR